MCSDSHLLGSFASVLPVLSVYPSVCLSVLQFVASKLSHRILEQAREQQDELQEEHGEGPGLLQRKRKK